LINGGGLANQEKARIEMPKDAPGEVVEKREGAPAYEHNIWGSFGRTLVLHRAQQLRSFSHYPEGSWSPSVTRLTCPCYLLTRMTKNSGARVGGRHQVYLKLVLNLPNKCEVLSSNPSTTKKRKKNWP
jgi:hypothetical protein